MNDNLRNFDSHEKAVAAGYEVMTRKEAEERGLDTFYPGKCCKRGHYTLRATSTGNCLACKWGITQE